MEEEIVIYNYYTGRPNEVLSDILRSISAYTRSDRMRSFKIGITNDPERRFQEEYAPYYDRMYVMYRSDSIDNVSILEESGKMGSGLAITHFA